MSRVANECDQVKTSAAGQRAWSKAETAVLQRLWGTIPVEDVAKRLQRSYHAVRKQAQRMGLSSMAHASRGRQLAPPRPQRPPPRTQTWPFVRRDSPYRKPSLPKLRFMGEV